MYRHGRAMRKIDAEGRKRTRYGELRESVSGAVSFYENNRQNDEFSVARQGRRYLFRSNNILFWEKAFYCGGVRVAERSTMKRLV